LRGATAATASPCTTRARRPKSANPRKNVPREPSYYLKYREIPCHARGANLPGFSCELGIRTSTLPCRVSFMNEWMFAPVTLFIAKVWIPSPISAYTREDARSDLS